MAEIKLRVNPLLKEQLKKIANNESRSLNKQIEVFLDFAVDCYEASKSAEVENKKSFVQNIADGRNTGANQC